MSASDYQNSDLDEANIRAGFTGVMEGVDMGGRDWEPVFSAFRDAIWNGERDGGQRAIDLYVDPSGWRWPRLEHAAADFEVAGVWPTSWRHLGIQAPFVWNKLDPMSRTKLLCDTLDVGVWRARARSSAEEFPSLYGLRLHAPFEPCPASAIFVGRFSARVEQGDHGHLPPFFPGDNTGLRLTRRRSSPKQAVWAAAQAAARRTGGMPLIDAETRVFGQRRAT